MAVSFINSDFKQFIYYILREINLNSKSKSITLLPQHREVTSSWMNENYYLYKKITTTNVNKTEQKKLKKRTLNFIYEISEEEVHLKLKIRNLFIGKKI